MTYKDKLDELVKQALALPEDTARGVVAMLETARKDLVARLASQPGGSFAEAQLRAVIAEADRVLKEFSARASSAIAKGQASGFALGGQMVDAPLAAAGLRGFLGGLPEHLLAVAQGYSADLVGGLTKEAQVKLNGVLRRAAIGGQSMTDIIKQVGVSLGNEAGPSLFSGITARAVAITRTEVGRMTSVATDARLQSWAQRVPDMQQEWRHSPQDHPRLGHLAMNGQTVRVGEKFVTPGGVELRYPRDPDAPASETVSCACLVLPKVPRSALQEAA